MGQKLGNTVWWFVEKGNTELPQDPAIPLLGIEPKNWQQSLEDASVRPRSSSIIHNSWKVEGNPSVHCQSNEPAVVYAQGINPSALTRKETLAPAPTRGNCEDSSTIRQWLKGKHCTRISPVQGPRSRPSHGTVSRRWCQGLGEGKGNEGFMGTEYRVWEEEKVLETVVIVAQECECQRTVGFQMLKMVHFMLRIFYHNRKRKEERKDYNLFWNCSKEEYTQLSENPVKWRPPWLWGHKHLGTGGRACTRAAPAEDGPIANRSTRTRSKHTQLR